MARVYTLEVMLQPTELPLTYISHVDCGILSPVGLIMLQVELWCKIISMSLCAV